MTVCVYHQNVLAADTLATAGTSIVSKSHIKIGMIYQDALTGQRSLNLESLSFPEEFAMYAVAGAAAIVNKFLRWFINTDHPIIDHEDFTGEDVDYIEPEAPFEAMVIFKDSEVVRLYDSDYLNNTFVDTSSEEITSIGCGSLSALAINAYDPKASSIDIIKAVIQIDIACGGSIATLQFTSESLYDEVNLIKAEKKQSREKWYFWKKK